MSEHKDFQGDSVTDFALEPCPFCGCQAKMQKLSLRSGWWYGVACRSSEGHGGDCAMEQVPSRTIEAAAKRWNMRKPMDQLKAKTETWCTYGADGCEHTYHGDKAAIEALTALIFEVEGLRKDAGRYQWLRDKSEVGHQFYLSVPLWFTGVRFRAQDVDNAIDAMSKGEQP